MCYLLEGRWWFQCVSYGHMAFMDFLKVNLYPPMNIEHGMIGILGLVSLNGSQKFQKFCPFDVMYVFAK